MLLRNYYNLLALLTMGVTNTGTSTFGDGHLNTKQRGGTIAALELNNYSYLNDYALGYATLTRIDGSTGGSGVVGLICLGSGDTAVTFDDYALASIISSGWTKGTPVVGAPAYNSETKKWTNTISFLCTNSSGSTMTIKEVGIYLPISNYNLTSLVYREVLATPVEITNENSSTITLNLEYTMPTV